MSDFDILNDYIKGDEFSTTSSGAKLTPNPSDIEQVTSKLSKEATKSIDTKYTSASEETSIGDIGVYSLKKPYREFIRGKIKND
jgi:hypothetical protein